MENYDFFAKFVCVFHYVVAAVQAQIASVKFAPCMQKCFRLRKFFNANSNSITIIKHSQGEIEKFTFMVKTVIRSKFLIILSK